MGQMDIAGYFTETIDKMAYHLNPLPANRSELSDFGLMPRNSLQETGIMFCIK